MEYDLNTETNNLPPLPQAPWATMLTTLLLLFVFGATMFVIYHYSPRFDESVTAQTGEQQLQELRDSERVILDNYGYDPETNTHRMPINNAMDELIKEAKANGGEMKSFPVKKGK